MTLRSAVLALFLWLTLGTGSTSATEIPATDLPATEIPAHPRLLVYPSVQFELPPRPPEFLAKENFRVAGLVQPDPLLPLAEITIAIPAGTVDDPAGAEGLAFFTAAMIRRGGSGDRTVQEIDRELDALGAELLMVALDSRSIARLSAPTWALDQSIDILFDLLVSPRFEQEAFELYRRSSLDALERRNDDANEVLRRAWQRVLLGPDHPASRWPTGKSLTSLTVTDLRRFHGCRWQSDGSVVALSGDLSAEVIAAIRERVVEWQNLPRPETCAEPPDPAEPIDAATATAPEIFIHPHEAPQAKVILGKRLVDLPDWTSPDRFALRVAEEILGGSGAISRINGRLRTFEGLVYRSSADLDIERPGRESLELFLETRPDQTWTAIEIALEEVERMRRELVHPRELQIVKDSLVGALRSDFDTAEEVVGHYAEDLLLERPTEYWSSYVAGIRQVTRDDVLRVSRQYFAPDLFEILAVGPEGLLLAEGADVLSRRFSNRPVRVLPRRDPVTLEAATGSP